MPRLKEITSRDDLPPEEREYFDLVAQSRGEVRLPYSVFLNHPKLAHRKLEVGSFVRFETSLPKDVQEVTICAAAREFDAGFIWHAHSRAALRAGVPESTLDVIANRGALDGLDAAQALGVTLTRQLLRDHRLDDATYAAADKRWGERGVIELVATVGYYVMSACWMNAMEVLPPEGGGLP